jgi:hypothetical protein
MKKAILCILTWVCLHSVGAQVAKTQVIQLKATAITNSSISLSWPQESWTGTWDIYRRTDLTSFNWGAKIASLAGVLSSFVDTGAKQGKAYEYRVIKNSTGGAQALGYIWAGNAYKEQPVSGRMILLIDSNYILPLASEIAKLKTQMTSEGWLIKTLYAGRKEKAKVVRDRIINEYDAKVGKYTTLLILGHVPVPYSGNFTGSDVPPPDGHVEGSGNHTGAWPADVYYGEMDGLWTDNITNVSGHTSRLYNNPGDGKWDQSKLPNDVELEVGRIDLFDMPTFSKNDTLLVKKYIQRNLLWRTGATKMIERAIIDNNFTGYNLASIAYHNFSTMIRLDSIFDNRDLIAAQKLGSYLWAYGCGAGSYQSCDGIGVTSNFADTQNNIFTSMVGSFFGDWDNTDNLLRAPLGRNSLISFWGGIPKWYVHHMGLGMHIGYGTKLTQNNVDFYYNGQFNSSDNSTHIALMGDPTLKMRHLAPVTKLTGLSQSNKVKLTWTKIKGTADGYIVYRYDSANHNYYRVNKNFIVKDTFYTDSTNYFNGRNLYVVRAVRLETTPSGTWYNLGGGVLMALNHTNSLESMPVLTLGISPNPATDIVKVQMPVSAQPNATVIVWNSQGSKVMEFAAGKGSYTEFNSAQLPSGMYVVTLQENGRRLATGKLARL